jgi:hypothetical protein
VVIKGVREDLRYGEKEMAVTLSVEEIDMPSISEAL